MSLTLRVYYLVPVISINANVRLSSLRRITIVNLLFLLYLMVVRSRLLCHTKQRGVLKSFQKTPILMDYIVLNLHVILEIIRLWIRSP